MNIRQIIASNSILHTHVVLMHKKNNELISLYSLVMGTTFHAGNKV